MCSQDMPLYYSLGFCPYDKAKCGEQRILTSKKAEEKALEITGQLSAGDFCYYGVVSDCGPVEIKAQSAD